MTVNETEVGGTSELELEVTSTYGWEDYYEFTPTTPGVYTFYLPANLGIWEKSSYEGTGVPMIDAFSPDYDGTEEHIITVTLKPGQKFCFYYGATTKGTFTIGYDAP